MEERKATVRNGQKNSRSNSGVPSSGKSSLITSPSPCQTGLTLCFLGACSLVAKLCPTLCDPLDCRLPGSSVHGIFQAKILEWVDISPPGDLPNPGIELAFPISCIAGRFFITEPPGKRPYSSQSHCLWQRLMYIPLNLHSLIFQDTTDRLHFPVYLQLDVAVE